MRLAFFTLLLAFAFSKAEAQYPCDIATTGVAIVNANGAPVSSICVGQHAYFKFSLSNMGTSTACTIPANSVSVTFDFPTLAGNVKPYVYAGPPSFSSGYFTWTYNAGAEVLVGTNTLAIPNGLGDADILVDVIGNTQQVASSNLNITQNMGISDNTANNTGSAQLTVNGSPTVTCPANITGVCTNSQPFALTGASPAGGSYAGPGVSGGMFDPSSAGVGVHTITYTYNSAANGCPGTCTFTITVTNPPSVTCPANITGICSNGASFPLTGGSPAGGTYSGPGVSSNTFSPSTAGAGTHTITYTYTSGNCTSTCTFTITVNAAPSVTCRGNITGVCTNSAPFALTGGSPANGTYSGPGVSANSFDPAAAGPGTHTITYSVTSNGCTSTCTFTITVTAAPVVTCPSNINGICTNAAAFALTGGSPANGTYTGPGVSSNTFNPATAGAGTHTITYSVTSNGCTSTCSFTITVTAAPVVTCRGNITGICTNTAPFALTGGSPAGGSFSGPGVSANNFDPSVAGAGTHTITYSVTSNGCTSSCTFTITVNAAPVVTCPQNSTACISSPAFPLTGGLPQGGTYSGPGVSANNFDPSSAGVGTHTITYSYTNTAGCSASCSFTITVTNTATVTCPSNITGICTNSASFALTGGSPAGGTYSGPGVSSNTFNPATAGAGTHTITYSQGAGCPGSCSFTITVTAAPSVSCRSNITGICTNSAPFALTGGSPANGIYSGPGVSANTFDPASAGAGTHTITYSVTSGGCSSSCAFTITVTAAPVVSCPSNITGICTNSAPFPLTGGSPANGTYTGPGVSANSFNPATAGAGTHTITYSVTSGGCTSTCTFTITVSSAPVATCPSNMTGICTNGSSFALTGGSPSGGNYSGPGVSGNVFTPANAGAGTHTISYTVTSGQCTSTCSFTITVNTPPVVSCPQDFTVCSNTAPFALTGSSPGGGTYSGNGVSANNFNPSAAGVGIHTITYSYTSTATGCTATCTFNINVTSTTVVACPGNITGICSNTNPFTLTGASPGGGTYSGPGVNNNVFNPSLAGVGTHTITYNVGGGCPGTCSFTITVDAPVVVTCPGNITDVCITASALPLSGATPGGGVYSGPGVNGNIFNPATAGPGTHTITYTVNNGNCASSCSFTITVKAVTGSISGNTTVTQGAGSSTITFTASGGTPNYTFTYNISVNGGPAGPNQTVSTSGGQSTVTLSQSHAVAGSFKYTLVSVVDNTNCSGSISGSNSATVNVVASAQLPTADLTPVITPVQGLNFPAAGNQKDFILNVVNNSATPSSGQLILRVVKLSAFSYNIPVANDNFGGTPTNNGDWIIDMVSDPSFVILTTKPGIVIAGNGSINLGIHVTRNSNVAPNTTQNMTIAIQNGTGGDSTPANNTATTALTAN